MDQIKIGKFIAARRKLENLTQAQLAEKLNITDRAVSKWETGKSLPDCSIMFQLCEILNISVNDLLCGEVVSMDDFNKELESNLLEMIKQKQGADKRLLTLEIFLGALVSAVFFALVIIASCGRMDDLLRVLLIVIGFAQFLAGCFYCLRIEQVAGYYVCGKCGHRYIPLYKSVLWARHIGRTRYMRCPECGNKSWQKKVIEQKQAD